jgi:hypothetical protein
VHFIVTSPRLQVLLPLAGSWPVGGDDSHIISLDVGRKQDVNRVARQSRQKQVARQALVVRIRLHDFVGLDGIENGLAWDEPAFETQVHVVRPQDSTTANTCLDEAYRIVRDRSLRRLHA